MAVVGHACVGLAAAGLASFATPRPRRSFIIPGLMVLAAYGLDVVEWLILVIRPDLPERHTLGRSIGALVGLALCACLTTWLLCRVRQPWLYLLVLAAVFSHLVADQWPVRLTIFRAYQNDWTADELPAFRTSVEAETWAYGLPLALVLLGRCLAERGISRAARTACWVLGVVSLMSFLSRQPAAWAPAYLLSAAHAGLVLRRHFDLRWLWNAVPLAPVAAMALASAVVETRVQHGRNLAAQGLHAQAIPLYQSVLWIPSRHGRGNAYQGLAMSYEALGELPEAERCYRAAIAQDNHSLWAEFLLARLYHRNPGTAVDRPQEAVQLMQSLIERSDTPKSIRTAAQNELDRWRARDAASTGGRP